LHPIDVHYGRAEQVRAIRAEVLDAAYARNPERFVGKPPQPAPLPTAAWINKPPDQTEPNQTAQSMNP
jgi:putative transposase